MTDQKVPGHDAALMREHIQRLKAATEAKYGKEILSLASALAVSKMLLVDVKGRIDDKTVAQLITVFAAVLQAIDNDILSQAIKCSAELEKASLDYAMSVA